MSMNPDPEFLKSIVTYKRGPLVGNLLNILLYGILTVQTYLYYIAFPNDKKIKKAIIAFVYSIDTAQTILALYDFYQLFCVYPPALYSNAHQWLTIALSSALIATVAQLYYAHRIYVLSKKKVITGIVIILAVGQLVSGVATAIFFHGIPGLLGSIASAVISLGQDSWGPAGAICDLVIAGYMTWFLTKQRRRLPSRKTQVMVTRIKRLVLETGLLTAVFATSYILLLVFVGRNTFTIPGLTLGKIYSNSILVLLNNRSTIAGGRNEPAFEFEANSYHLSDLPRREGAEHGIRE